MMKKIAVRPFLLGIPTRFRALVMTASELLALYIVEPLVEAMFPDLRAVRIEAEKRDE